MYKGKQITVSIPALNEEENIDKVLKSLPNIVDNIIVINDGSTDRTAQIAEDNGAIVVTHKTNKTYHFLYICLSKIYK